MESLLHTGTDMEHTGPIGRLKINSMRNCSNVRVVPLAFTFYSRVINNIALCLFVFT